MLKGFLEGNPQDSVACKADSICHHAWRFFSVQQISLSVNYVLKKHSNASSLISTASVIIFSQIYYKGSLQKVMKVVFNQQCAAAALDHWKCRVIITVGRGPQIVLIRVKCLICSFYFKLTP